jgi:hypothetical protein
MSKTTTHITITDGIATFEDGSTVAATVEQIAALPDLLEALKALAPILDNDGPLVAAYADAEHLVSAAIARAEGRA